MTRTLNTGMASDIGASSAEVCHLVQLAFGAGTVYLTDAGQSILWGGNTYQAVGGNLSVGDLQELTDDNGQQLQLTLGGVDITLLGTILGQTYRGRNAKVYYAHLLNGAVVADPVLMWSGFMNGGFTIQDVRPSDGTAGSVTITTQISGRLGELARVKGIRTNIQSHQQYYSTDTFFQNTPNLVGRVIYWGRVPSTASGNGSNPDKTDAPKNNRILRL